MNRIEAKTEIGSGDALFGVLRSDLNYCGCAYTDAVPFLHELLRRVAERTDSLNDDARFRRVSEALEAWMLEHASGGVASWIIYGFEQAGLLYHGWNLFDITLTDKGRRVLAALDRFPDPRPDLGVADEDDADAAADSPARP